MPNPPTDRPGVQVGQTIFRRPANLLELGSQREALEWVSCRVKNSPVCLSDMHNIAIPSLRILLLPLLLELECSHAFESA